MRQQLPGGVGLDDRMPSGSREPKGRPKKETRDVMTVSLHNPARTYDTTSHHPAFPAGDSLPVFFARADRRLPRLPSCLPAFSSL
ncbi:hypothetical protein R281_24670 [Salmonella enterica]|nr:hypothetical protein [Salmonella enterica]ECD6753795.1 hypothetical protein [Salmonella enterica subsp. enterica serovar Muenster]EDP9449938.1 hypothetical protein [Salmonella enterica subsp. enterica]EBP1158792.1 hypothetical protein [Salmonella enterica]ECD9439576.1 hypothetical protein [Salmonella enterica]